MMTLPAENTQWKAGIIGPWAMTISPLPGILKR